MLLQDAFVLRDREALIRLFEPRAVLCTAAGDPLARGLEEIVPGRDQSVGPQVDVRRRPTTASSRRGERRSFFRRRPSTWHAVTTAASGASRSPASSSSRRCSYLTLTRPADGSTSTGESDSKHDRKGGRRLDATAPRAERARAFGGRGRLGWPDRRVVRAGAAPPIEDLDVPADAGDEPHNSWPCAHQSRYSPSGLLLGLAVNFVGTDAG